MTDDTEALADAVIALGGLVLDFGLVERATYHPDGTTRETDTTHTVMLGVIGCAIAEQHFPDLDRGLIAQLALVHDLVEVHAGDTPTLRMPSAEETARKADRERRAYERIRDEFRALPWGCHRDQWLRGPEHTGSALRQGIGQAGAQDRAHPQRRGDDQRSGPEPR